MNDLDQYINIKVSTRKARKSSIFDELGNLIKPKTSDYSKVYKLLTEEKDKGCQICGYNRCKRSLHFHHLDSKLKSFSMSQAKAFPLEDVKAEIQKCILVCANCHGEIHDNLISPFTSRVSESQT